MGKYTKAPWKMIKELEDNEKTLSIYAEFFEGKKNNKRRGLIAQVSPCGNGCDDETAIEAEANAQLIASAPELLEVCKKARKLYDELSMSNLEIACKYGDEYEPMGEKDCLEMRKALDQAISKAEGK